MVKLRPTPEQKLLLEQWHDSARFSYNETVRRLRAGVKPNKMQLRNAIVTEKDNVFVAARPWLLRTPKAIRQQAVFRACAAHSGGLTKLRRGLIRRFELKMQRKKELSWTFGIERNCRPDASRKRLMIFPRMLQGGVRFFGKLPPLDKDMQIHKDQVGRFFLGVPIEVARRQREADDRPSVSIDPGVRKFLTTFDDVGTAQMIGTDVQNRTYDILKSIDDINIFMKQAHHAEKQRLRKKKLSLYKKYQDLRDEFHWKTAAALTDEYGMIIMPKLDVQRLIRRSDETHTRRLRTKAVRQMVFAGHGLFRRRLQEKCLEKGTTFIDAHECYTSKTCSCCGQMSSVGSSEVFKCAGGCGLVSDRDLNAAKNIMLANTYRGELPPELLNFVANTDMNEAVTLSFEDLTVLPQESDRQSVLGPSDRTVIEDDGD